MTPRTCSTEAYLVHLLRDVRRIVHPRLLLLVVLSFGTACPGDATHAPATGTTGDPDPDETTTSTTTGLDLPEPTTADPTTTGTTGTGSTGEPATTGAPGVMCGDGVIGPGEECDDGPNNANTAACTLECKHAACGDGLVHAGVEQCDYGLGNSHNYGGCRPDTCKFGPRCGDGLLDPEHEICDRGPWNGTGHTDDEMAPCSLTCRYHARPVFVTSKLFDGALAGVSGADLQCGHLADAAGLAHPYAYKAWLASGFEGPGTRFDQAGLSSVPYMLLDGRVLAQDLDELVTTGPRTGIALTDQLEMVFDKFAWTNVSAFGGVFSPEDHCAHWTSNSGELVARVGKNAIPVEDGPAWQTWLTQRHWTTFFSANCDQSQRLYCFDDGFVEDTED